jgi:hypothetical protein
MTTCTQTHSTIIALQKQQDLDLLLAAGMTVSHLRGSCLLRDNMPLYLVWRVPFSGESIHLHTPPLSHKQHHSSRVSLASSLCESRHTQQRAAIRHSTTRQLSQGVDEPGNWDMSPGKHHPHSCQGGCARVHHAMGLHCAPPALTSPTPPWFWVRTP